MKVNKLIFLKFFNLPNRKKTVFFELLNLNIGGLFVHFGFLICRIRVTFVATIFAAHADSVADIAAGRC